MKLAVLKERRTDERRVALTPDLVAKYMALGFTVAVESRAGVAASFSDDMYKAAGAEVVSSAATLLQQADVVLKVQRPMVAAENIDEFSLLRPGSLLIGMLNPHGAGSQVQNYATAHIDTFAMELMPRITRAQSMDVLSSQANLAGYKAVLMATEHFNRALPMMMTAAGRINPARVFVMGAGVAGLQAIATAKRLGAVVSATDVRMAAKEQVQSLGGTFVMVENEETKAAETSGGYAKEMSDDYKRQQAELVATTVKTQDIVITTALIPGRPAPKLLTAAHVRSMKPGSVIVDMAVEAGGNCELSKAGEVVNEGGVIIVGHRNIPSLIAADASQLYARNIFNFIAASINRETKQFVINPEDELIKAIQLTRGGQVVHPQFASTAAA